MWLAVALTAVASYAMRLLPMMMLSGRRLGGTAMSLLRDAGVGGLTGLAVLSFVGGATSWGAASAGVGLSVVAAGWLVLRGRSMAVAVGGGVVALALTWTLVRLLGG